MKKIKVKTVSEYIKIIENLGMEDYIYRGQIHPYFRIQASCFRPYLGGWSSDKIFNIKKISDEFYRKVLRKLSEDERKHFIAYCQHHGIPTNLVDFSYSPLVALFFSCEGKGEMAFSITELIGNHTIEELENDNVLKDMLIHNLINKSQKDFYSNYGQIYLINRKRLIDITDIIVDIQRDNIFEQMLVDKELRIKLGYKIINWFDDKGLEDSVYYVLNLINTYEQNKMDFYEYVGEHHRKENIYIYVDGLKNGDVYDTLEKLYKFIVNEFEDETIIYDFEGVGNTFGKVYFFLFYNLIDLFKKYPDKYICLLDFYLIYTPPNLFSRLDNQKGLFVYQPYLYTKDVGYNYNELTVQYICPDVEIEVDNYNTIINELDCLGINAGFLYGDIDNIAKTICKSAKLLDAKEF